MLLHTMLLLFFVEWCAYGIDRRMAVGRNESNSRKGRELPASSLPEDPSLLEARSSQLLNYSELTTANSFLPGTRRWSVPWLAARSAVPWLRLETADSTL